ncbi:MAG: MerR family transcriptional regulator [Flavobacteriales bacterium]
MKERGIAQQFSIKDLEHFTGIKSHTIRIWEQRYELLIPKRTPTNIRYYGGDDLKKLLNTSYLIEQGHKISKIAAMSDQQLLDEVQKHQLEEGGLSAVLSHLKLSMLNYDEALFDQVITDCVNEIGLEETVLDVFLPFLSQIGVLWLTNSICPAQEHFISHLMRQELHAAIANCKVQYDDKLPPIVLYLPEREIHDISLLFIHYLCRIRGIRSIFLGASVPFNDLIQIAEQFPNARFVAYCTTHPSSSESAAYVEMINDEFASSGVKFMVAGRVFEGVKASGCVNTAVNGQELVANLFG